MAAVIDPDLIEKLNALEMQQSAPTEDANLQSILDKKFNEQQLQNAIQQIHQQQTGAMGAFGRSAATAMPQAIQNLVSKLGIVFPSIEGGLDKSIAPVPGEKIPSLEQILPKALVPKKGDEAHPIAQFLGGMAGFGPLAFGTSTALRAIPAWGRVAEAAKGSILKSSGVLAAEGGLMGGAFGQPGNVPQDIALGALMGGLLGGGSQALKSVRNINRSIRDIPQTEGQIKSTESQLKQAGENIDAAYEKYGSKNPVTLKNRADNLTTQINDLTEALKSIPKKDIKEPATVKIPNWADEHAENLQKEAASLSEQSANQIKSYLGAEKTHDIYLASDLNKALDQNKAEIRNIYSSLDDSLSQKNVPISLSRSESEILSDVRKLISEGKAQSAEVRALADELAAVDKSKFMTADNYLNAIRTIKDTQFNLNKKAYAVDTSLTADERQSLIAQSKELGNKAKSMTATLREYLSPEEQQMLDEATNRWRDEVASLYKNRIFRHLQNYNRIPGDIIDKLAGEEKGNSILRGYVLRKPEMTKAALGNRFANNPDALADFGSPFFKEDALPYINNDKNLQGLAAQHQQNLKSLAESKMAIKDIKKAQQKQKSAEQELSERKKIQSSRAEKEKQLTNAMRELEKINAGIKELKKQISLKNKSTEELKQLNDKLNIANKRKDVLKNKLFKLLKMGAYIVAGKSILSQAMSMLFKD